MSPRPRRPTIEQLGIEKVFADRKLSLELFKLLVKSDLTDAAIARTLSEEYLERMGVPQSVRAATVKRYRGLL